MLRVITGLTLFSIFIFPLITGGLFFQGMVIVIMGLISWEMVRLSRYYSLLLLHPIGPVSLGILMMLPPSLPLVQSPFFLILILLMTTLGILEVARKSLSFQLPTLYKLRPYFFIGLSLPYLALIRNESQGIYLVLLLCLIIWSTDIFALYGGKRFGKTPLSSISPNKTIEGSAIGFLTAAVIGALFCYISPLPFTSYFWVAIPLSLLSQIGDLHESLTKRTFNQKDSSNLLPGHGGFYDRMDSFIFTTPLFYYYVIYIQYGL